MAQAKKKAQKAQKAAMKARYNPYVKRIVEDEDLRDNLVQAYESARKAYGRLSNGKSPTKQIFDDKKLQKDIKRSASSVKDASFALRQSPKKRRGAGKFMVLGLAGAGVALAVSSDLRKKVLDTLFGAEEEFEYTSTTTAPTPSGETAGASNN